MFVIKVTGAGGGRLMILEKGEKCGTIDKNRVKPKAHEWIHQGLKDH